VALGKDPLYFNQRFFCGEPKAFLIKRASKIVSLSAKRFVNTLI
jgi:hypothetical protein